MTKNVFNKVSMKKMIKFKDDRLHNFKNLTSKNVFRNEWFKFKKNKPWDIFKH